MQKKDTNKTHVKYALRQSLFAVLCSALIAGTGFAALPTYAGDAEPVEELRAEESMEMFSEELSFSEEMLEEILEEEILPLDEEMEIFPSEEVILPEEELPEALGEEAGEELPEMIMEDPSPAPEEVPALDIPEVQEESPVIQGEEPAEILPAEEELPSPELPKEEQPAEEILPSEEESEPQEIVMPEENRSEVPEEAEPMKEAPEDPADDDSLTLMAPDSLYRIKISGICDYQKAQEALGYINDYRATRGSGPLKMDSQLLSFAMQRAAETAVDWDHKRPDGSDPWVLPDMAGECLVVSSSARGAIDAWINSSAHNAIMTNPEAFCAGVGCFKHNNRYYWVLLTGYNTGSQDTTLGKETKTMTIDLLEKTDPLYFNLGKISKTTSEIKIKPGETFQLTVNRENSELRDYGAPYSIISASSMTWKSSNPQIASVDSKGLVTALRYGMTTITATTKAGLKNEPGIAAIRFVVEGNSIMDATVKLSATNMTYTGKALKPSVTVSLNNSVNGIQVLKQGTDYTVSYENNVNCGTGRVIIKGKGDFGGTIVKEFRILPKSLNANSVSVNMSTTSVLYYGVARHPSITVTDGTKVLKKGTDYTLKWENNLNAGAAEVIVYGKGNYTGGSGFGFTIREAPLSKTKIALSTSNSLTYNGKAHKPSVTVTYRGMTLKNKTDYTVSYKNNVQAGTASVTIKGKGNFTGSVTKTFTISKAANTISKATASKALSYSKKKAQTFAMGGSAKESAKITWSLTKCPDKVKDYVSVSKTGTVTLKAGMPKGTYTLKVTGTTAATSNYKKTAVKQTVTVKIK